MTAPACQLNDPTVPHPQLHPAADPSPPADMSVPLPPTPPPVPNFESAPFPAMTLGAFGFAADNTNRRMRANSTSVEPLLPGDMHLAPQAIDRHQFHPVPQQQHKLPQHRHEAQVPMHHATANNFNGLDSRLPDAFISSASAPTPPHHLQSPLGAPVNVNPVRQPVRQPPSSDVQPLPDHVGVPSSSQMFSAIARRMSTVANTAIAISTTPTANPAPESGAYTTPAYASGNPRPYQNWPLTATFNDPSRMGPPPPPPLPPPIPNFPAIVPPTLPSRVRRSTRRYPALCPQPTPSDDFYMGLSLGSVGAAIHNIPPASSSRAHLNVAHRPPLTPPVNATPSTPLDRAYTSADNVGNIQHNVTLPISHTPALSTPSNQQPSVSRPSVSRSRFLPTTHNPLGSAASVSFSYRRPEQPRSTNISLSVSPTSSALRNSNLQQSVAMRPSPSNSFRNAVQPSHLTPSSSLHTPAQTPIPRNSRRVLSTSHLPIRQPLDIRRNSTPVTKAARKPRRQSNRKRTSTALGKMDAGTVNPVAQVDHSSLVPATPVTKATRSAQPGQADPSATVHAPLPSFVPAPNAAHPTSSGGDFIPFLNTVHNGPPDFSILGAYSTIPVPPSQQTAPISPQALIPAVRDLGRVSVLRPPQPTALTDHVNARDDAPIISIATSYPNSISDPYAPSAQGPDTGMTAPSANVSLPNFPRYGDAAPMLGAANLTSQHVGISEPVAVGPQEAPFSVPNSAIPVSGDLSSPAFLGLQDAPLVPSPSVSRDFINAPSGFPVASAPHLHAIPASSFTAKRGQSSMPLPKFQGREGLRRHVDGGKDVSGTTKKPSLSIAQPPKPAALIKKTGSARAPSRSPIRRNEVDLASRAKHGSPTKKSSVPAVPSRRKPLVAAAGRTGKATQSQPKRSTRSAHSLARPVKSGPRADLTYQTPTDPNVFVAQVSLPSTIPPSPFLIAPVIASGDVHANAHAVASEAPLLRKRASALATAPVTSPLTVPATAPVRVCSTLPTTVPATPQVCHVAGPVTSIATASEMVPVSEPVQVPRTKFTTPLATTPDSAPVAAPLKQSSTMPSTVPAPAPTSVPSTAPAMVSLALPVTSVAPATKRVVSTPSPMSPPMLSLSNARPVPMAASSLGRRNSRPVVMLPAPRPLVTTGTRVEVPTPPEVVVTQCTAAVGSRVPKVSTNPPRRVKELVQNLKPSSKKARNCKVTKPARAPESLSAPAANVVKPASAPTRTTPFDRSKSLPAARTSSLDVQTEVEPSNVKLSAIPAKANPAAGKPSATRPRVSTSADARRSVTGSAANLRSARRMASPESGNQAVGKPVNMTLPSVAGSSPVRLSGTHTALQGGKKPSPSAAFAFPTETEVMSKAVEEVVMRSTGNDAMRSTPPSVKHTSGLEGSLLQSLTSPTGLSMQQGMVLPVLPEIGSSRVVAQSARPSTRLSLNEQVGNDAAHLPRRCSVTVDDVAQVSSPQQPLNQSSHCRSASIPTYGCPSKPTARPQVAVRTAVTTDDDLFPSENTAMNLISPNLVEVTATGLGASRGENALSGETDEFANSLGRISTPESDTDAGTPETDDSTPGQIGGSPKKLVELPALHALQSSPPRRERRVDEEICDEIQPVTRERVTCIPAKLKGVISGQGNEHSTARQVSVSGHGNTEKLVPIVGTKRRASLERECVKRRRVWFAIPNGTAPSQTGRTYPTPHTPTSILKKLSTPESPARPSVEHDANAVDSPGLLTDAAQPFLAEAPSSGNGRNAGFKIQLRLRIRPRNVEVDTCHKNGRGDVVPGVADGEVRSISKKVKAAHDGGAASISVVDTTAFNALESVNAGIRSSPFCVTAICGLCDAHIGPEKCTTHPLFQLRALQICLQCCDFVADKLMSQKNVTTKKFEVGVAAMKAGFFVAVVEDMLLSMRGGEVSARKVSKAFKAVASRKRCEHVERMQALYAPYDFVAVTRYVLGKLGVQIRNGKLQWLHDVLDVRPDDGVNYMRLALPPTIEDLAKGSTRGERAWQSMFPPIALNEDTPSCVVVEKLLELIGIKVKQTECKHGMNESKKCRVHLDMCSLLAAMHRAASWSPDVDMKAVFAQGWSRKDALRTLRGLDLEVMGQDDDLHLDLDGCCVCGNEHDVNKYPLRFAECFDCERRFCSSCLVNVLGSSEYVQATRRDKYFCALCRFRSNPNVMEQNGCPFTGAKAREERSGRKKLDIRVGRVRKVRDTRRASVPLMRLTLNARAEMLAHGHDNREFTQTVGFAKLCEYANDRLLNGGRTVPREKCELVCLLCKKLCKRPRVSMANGGCNDSGDADGAESNAVDEFVRCSAQHCPTVMHRSCSGEDVQVRRRGTRLKWVCGHHQCAQCDQREESKLVRCKTCPTAFCKEHLGSLSDVYFLQDRVITCASCRLHVKCPQKVMMLKAGNAAGRKGDAIMLRKASGSLKNSLSVSSTSEANQQQGYLNSYRL